MKESYFKFATRNIPELSNSLGACFAAARNAQRFEYVVTLKNVADFSEKELTKKQRIDYIKECVDETIDQLKLPCIFTITPRKTASYNFMFEDTGDSSSMAVYLAVIMSRFAVSNDYEYIRTMKIIYTLRKKGYTAMEAFLISCGYGQNGYYSYCDFGIYDIEAFRNMSDEDRNTIINNNSVNISFNTFKISNGILLKNENDYESAYLKAVESLKTLDKTKFITFENVILESITNTDMSAVKIVKDFPNDYRLSNYISSVYVRNRNSITKFIELDKVLDRLEFIDYENIPSNQRYFTTSLLLQKGIKKITT